MISPSAEAELNFRTVGPGSEVLARLAPLRSRVALETVLEVPPVRMRTLPGFDAAAFAFTTDIPLLDRWGGAAPLRPRVHSRRPHRRGARRDEQGLEAAAVAYERLARALLREDRGRAAS